MKKTVAARENITLLYKNRHKLTLISLIFNLLKPRKPGVTVVTVQ